MRAKHRRPSTRAKRSSVARVSRTVRFPHVALVRGRSRFTALLWPCLLSAALAGCGGNTTSTPALSLRTPMPGTSSTPSPRPTTSSSPSPSPTATPTNAPAGQFREYAIPTQNASPVDIVAGPDGALWFTEAAGKIGRITTTGEITEFPQAVGSPGSITVGPDGALWFAEQDAIGRITTAGASQLFPAVVNGSDQIAGITAGPDGALWFTAQNLGMSPSSSAIGRIATTGQVTSFTLPPSRDPTGITTGPDGALWFAEGGGFGSGTYYSAIGRMTTSGKLSEYGDLTGFMFPEQIIAAPDGALWYTNNGAIGRITTTGQIALYGVPNDGDGYGGYIVPGPDRTLWFSGNGFVGRVTLDGTAEITVFPVPHALPNRTPLGGIAAGSDGAIWFVDAETNTIDRVTTGRTPNARKRPSNRSGLR